MSEMLREARDWIEQKAALHAGWMCGCEICGNSWDYDGTPEHQPDCLISRLDAEIATPVAAQGGAWQDDEDDDLGILLEHGKLWRGRTKALQAVAVKARDTIRNTWRRNEKQDEKYYQSCTGCGARWANTGATNLEWHKPDCLITELSAAITGTVPASPAAARPDPRDGVGFREERAIPYWVERCRKADADLATLWHFATCPREDCERCCREEPIIKRIRDDQKASGNEYEAVYAEAVRKAADRD